MIQENHQNWSPENFLLYIYTVYIVHNNDGKISISLCSVKDYMTNWSQLRRFYNYRITTKQVQLVRRHSQSLLSTSTAATAAAPNQNSLDQSHHHLHRRNASDSTHTASHYCQSLLTERKDVYGSERQNGSRMIKSHLRSVSFSSFQSPITHDGHDCNGYSLDSSRLQKPKESELQSITSMIDFDESYSRRVLGFNSVEDMYKWVSCVKLMYQIKELPMLITNALDDPLIVRECHEIPEKYTGMIMGHRLVTACVIVKRIPYSRKIWLGIKFWQFCGLPSQLPN